jgi:hypothetical protein
MAAVSEGEHSSERRDFFVSYTGADEAWAEWVAYELEEARRRSRIAHLTYSMRTSLPGRLFWLVALAERRNRRPDHWNRWPFESVSQTTADALRTDQTVKTPGRRQPLCSPWREACPGGAYCGPDMVTPSMAIEVHRRPM